MHDTDRQDGWRRATGTGPAGKLLECMSGTVLERHIHTTKDEGPMASCMMGTLLKEKRVKRGRSSAAIDKGADIGSD